MVRIAYSLLSLFLVVVSFCFNLHAENKAPDKGDFILSFKKPTDSRQSDLYTILKDDDTFQNLISVLNKSISLPRNIPVLFQSCEEANAFYDPEKRTVIMCYELVSHFLDILNDTAKSDEELGNTVVDATIFILFHEIGHSLVENLDIPITGKEEDAVDDLAGLVALGFDEQGEVLLASAAEAFGAMASSEGYDNLPFHDEHSLSAQRMYTTICLLYGSNPEKFDNLVGEDMLPPERAERCPGEYAQKSKSWEKLVGRYFKS